MASKRKKVDSSSSSQPFDRRRFVSFVASQRYHKLLANKSLIPERGLTPDPQDGDMLAMIHARHWQLFVSQPEPAAVNIVKEFYANGKEAKGNSVMVRGQWINVGRKALNAYYGLSKIHNSGYERYLDSDLDYSEVVLRLCEPGTDWKLTPTNEATNFPSSKLSRYGKAWFSFICAKLMPARHKTEVTKERAALLYCLVMDMSLDVGAMIHASIVKALEGGTSGGLPHPSLITDLCRRGGVAWDKEEVMLAPLTPLTHSLILRYKVWDGGVSHSKGLGYIIPADAPEPNPSAIEPDITIPPSHITDESRRDSRHHSRRIDLLARRVDQVMQRMDRLAERQEEMHSYNVRANTALVDMMSMMNPTLPFASFPSPSILPHYPPPDVNEDVDDDIDDEADPEE